jgi:hypothetical protein
MAMDGVEIMRPRRVTPKVLSELYGATKMAEDVRQLAATLKLERVYIVDHDNVELLRSFAVIRRTRGALRHTLERELRTLIEEWFSRVEKEPG